MKQKALDPTDPIVSPKHPKVGDKPRILNQKSPTNPRQFCISHYCELSETRSNAFDTIPIATPVQFNRLYAACDRAASCYRWPLDARCNCFVMNTLIRLIAQAIARPFERIYRAREGIGDGRDLKISNLNYALVPFVIALLVCGLAAFLTVALLRQKPDDLRSSLPWLGGLLLFAGVAFWLGTKRVLWLRIDRAMKLVRLFSVKQYAITDVKRWGFLWGHTDIRHQPPPSEATFLIEFADGTEFERLVAPHLAERIAAEMNRLPPAWQ